MTTSAGYASLGGYLNMNLDLGSAVANTYDQFGDLISTVSSYDLLHARC